jgi:hypothetical protein
MVIAIPFLMKGWHARPGKETVTEELLPQRLESPSGTGRVVTPDSNRSSQSEQPHTRTVMDDHQSHWAI